jgi:hypothetical protein
LYHTGNRVRITHTERKVRKKNLEEIEALGTYLQREEAESEQRK